MKKKKYTAWQMIGFDEGTFRVKGGRANWQAVMYNSYNNGRLVKLARIEGGPYERYVDPDTELIPNDPNSFEEYLNGD